MRKVLISRSISGIVTAAGPVPAETPDLLQDNEMLIRLVTSFATTEDDVDRFLDVLA